MNANTTFEVKAGNFTAGAKTARLAAAVYDQNTKQLVAVYLGAPVDMTVPEGSSYAIQNMSVTAVSYTHLDVYKRQELYGAVQGHYQGRYGRI